MDEGPSLATPMPPSRDEQSETVRQELAKPKWQKAWRQFRNRGLKDRWLKRGIYAEPEGGESPG